MHLRIWLLHQIRYWRCYGCDASNLSAICYVISVLHIFAQKRFFSKKRLIDKLDDITLLVCILLFASLFRGMVVVAKKTAYDSNAGFVIEALSEVFQVSSAFYFVYFGRQLTTKVIREKTMVIRVLGRIKRIIVVIIVLLFVRMVFRILKLDLASTVIRVIFSVIYGIIFACAAKMILHSQSVMNKVKQEDEVISLIRFVNRIILGVFIVFFLGLSLLDS